MYTEQYHTSVQYVGTVHGTVIRSTVHAVQYVAITKKPIFAHKTKIRSDGSIPLSFFPQDVERQRIRRTWGSYYHAWNQREWPEQELSFFSPDEYRVHGGYR